MKETSQHTRAYQFWYDLGVTRSYPQVAHKFHVSTTSIKKWAKAHGWIERARLQDIQNTKTELEKIANQKIKQEKDLISVKDAYRKDIDNTLKIIKDTILSAVNKDTKKLNVKAETPSDINALATAYEKLAKLDILLSEDEIPKVENTTKFQLIVPNKNRKNKPGGGRRTKLTPELQDELLKNIRSDMTINRACLLCGITAPTLFYWKRNGEAEIERIAQEVNKAKKAAIEQGILSKIDSIAIEEFIDNKINELKPNIYFYFLVEIQKANAEAEAKNLAAIHRARDGGEYVSEMHLIKNSHGKVTGHKEMKKYIRPTWTAAAWILERKHPELYSQRIKTDGRIEHDHAHKHEHNVSIPESADRVAGVLSILLRSGFITRGLIEHNRRESADHKIIDAKTD
jgi:transposase